MAVLKFEIFDQNLKKVESLKKEYPNLKRYDDVSTKLMTESTEGLRRERDALRNELTFSGFEDYISFLDNKRKYLTNGKLDLVTSEKLKYPALRKQIYDNIPDFYREDKKIRNILLNKSKSKFEEMFQNQKLLSRYSSQLNRSHKVILNYLVQNNIQVAPMCLGFIDLSYYFVTVLPDINPFQLNEILITKSIVNQISKVLDKTKEKFDWRKINVSYLNKSIAELVSNKVNTLKEGNQVKFIGELNDEFIKKHGDLKLTNGKVYTVNYARLNWDCLVVTIHNDDNRRIELPYRYFDEITKMRDDKISFLFED